MRKCNVYYTEKLAITYDALKGYPCCEILYCHLLSCCDRTYTTVEHHSIHREQFTRLIQYCCICESTQVRTCKLIPFITYCRSDPFVQKYAGEDDVCQSLYPRSFEGVVPRSVLKALRYYRYGAVKHNNHQKLLFTAASQVSGRFNVVHRN